MDALHIAMLPVFVLLGLLIGWAYFSLMRISLPQLDKGKAGVMRFVALVLLRALLFVGGGLLAMFLIGIWHLIAYCVGFFVVRTIIVSRARKMISLSPLTSKAGKCNV